MTAAAVSVVVPVRNEREGIEGLLENVFSQQGAGEMEVIVADGMSDDGTRELLERRARSEPGLKVMDNRGQFVSAGLNLAIRHASAPIIVRMDAHTVYAPDYVARCVETLESTGADNVGGAARTRADSYFQKANALAYRSPFSVGGARFHDPEYEGWVDTVTYGCWRKETLERLGLFDEELVRNQDDELNLRLIRSGGRIWQSRSIRSWYSPRSSLGALFRQYFQYGYWKVRVIRKHRLPASLRHLVPGAFVSLLLVLSVLALLSSWGRLALAGLSSSYLLALLGAALVTCRRPEQLKFLPVMPLVFAAYHFGYGLGFLLGVIDFVVLKKAGREALHGLTR